jgi:small subunit ribosomal protein S6
LAYEMMVVFNGMLEDSVLDKEIAALEELLKKNGELQKTERLGKRRLAYPIKKKTQGDYTVFNFTVPTPFVAELENGFQVNPNLLRFAIVKKS